MASRTVASDHGARKPGLSQKPAPRGGGGLTITITYEAVAASGSARLCIRRSFDRPIIHAEKKSRTNVEAFPCRSSLDQMVGHVDAMENSNA